MVKRFFRDVKRYFSYTVFSAKAELKSEVAGSFLSWLWWFLDPLLFMLVYTFIAIIIFKSGEPYFPVFVFIGLNSWNFFNKTVKSSIKLVSAKKMIVTKIYVPKYLFVFEKMGVYGFKMLVSYSLTIALMIIYRVPVSIKMLWAIPIMIIMAVFTFGVSTIVMHFGVFVEDLFNVITVVLQLVFYLSGIFYSIEKKVPSHYTLLGLTINPKVVLLKCNPMALILTDLRNVLLYNKDPHWVVLLFWLGVGLILSVIGVRTIYKQENGYVKVI